MTLIQERNGASNGTSLNGRLVAAFRDDDSARDLLRKVGGDELQFCFQGGAAYTVGSLVYQFWGCNHRATVSNLISNNTDYLIQIGLHFISDQNEALSLYRRCGVRDKRFLGPLTKHGHIAVLSRRCVLFIGLLAKTGRGQMLREVLGIKDPLKPLSASKAFAMAGLSVYTPIAPRLIEETPAQEKVMEPVEPVVTTAAEMQLEIAAPSSMTEELPELGAIVKAYLSKCLLVQDEVRFHQQQIEFHRKEAEKLQAEAARLTKCAEALEVAQELCEEGKA